MYGLIGETLGHSFSKEIHEQLADYTYHLYPLNKKEFHTFMTAREFRAINVTIPYKQAVLPYLDGIDDKAQRIGAVNTIVHNEGRLIGYNTDYDGFLYTLRQHRIQVIGKKVLMLGNGGAAQAVKAVLHDLHAKEIILVKSRPSKETIRYEEAYRCHRDAAIIINTSPVGMFPNNDSPIDLRQFPSLEHVVDIIYNPLRTSLIMQAKELGIPTAGGLEMLIAQAKAAVEHFTGNRISDSSIHTIYRNILCTQSNLVLIGMPSSGKTTVGNIMAKKLHKNFVDIDEEIVKESGKSIRELFAENGEGYFRDMEEMITKRFAMRHNQVIATGGGCIKRSSNIRHLQQNGILFFLDRSKELLVSKDIERPLSSSREKVYQMYDDRFPIYRQYADCIIKNDKTAEEAAKEIQRRYAEIIQNT